MGLSTSHAITALAKEKMNDCIGPRADVTVTPGGISITAPVSSVELTGRYGEGSGISALPAGGSVWTRLTFNVRGLGKVEFLKAGVLDIQPGDIVTVSGGFD